MVGMGKGIDVGTLSLYLYPRVWVYPRVYPYSITLSIYIFLTNIYQLCPILIVITIILMGTHQYPRVYPHQCLSST